MFTLQDCTVNDLAAEIAAEVLRSAKVRLSPKDAGQLPPHAGKTQESWSAALVELDEHVDITYGREPLGQNGSEKRGNEHWQERG